MFGIFAGTYFWFPKMFGRMMNETLGKIHFWLSFVGAYCIFMPFHYLGMAGNVRRYQAFVDDYLQPLIPVHKFITVAALVTGAAQFIFFYNLIHSRFWGKPAPDNPWEATSLEWSTPTPPPFDNFGGKHPVVYHDPYQYGVESSVGDYVMQASPEQVADRARREVATRRPRERLTGRSRAYGNDSPRTAARSNSRRHAPRLRAMAAGGIWFPADGDLRAVKDYSPPPARTGIWVVLAAITMMFAAFTSALIVRKGSALDWQHFHLAADPLLQYAGAPRQQRHSGSRAPPRCHLHGRRRTMPGASPARWLYITLFLGLLFVAGQYVAWLQLRAQGLYLATNPSSSFFYVLTAVHALHVLGGLGGLALRDSRSCNKSELRRSTLDATARYWHFMDVLWVYLLLLLWMKL